ncbi:ROK family protein [Nakamurella endophytica]|uniref:Glucokinase n=1 Tax=Nakamurella endophytica TaxID=1748367 RepID=A0A917T7R6_9ACTN|nr:ROK family protein [Nakamurella endophytica]GGM12617.1 glucokinase [Nakamurella endophytica]
MSGTAGTVVGIDIGGTSVRAGVLDPSDPDCRILEIVAAPTPHTVPETEDTLAGLVDVLRERHSVRAVGLAVAGFVSTDRARVMFAPHLAWRHDPVPEQLSARIGLPVVMDHDVNSAAWAEYRHGAAAGSPVALLVALGTGIGAGLVVHGDIYRGAHGVAPELGHVVVVPGGRPCPCGKRGCWERYCSGTALADTARELAADPAFAGQPAMGGDTGAPITGAMVAAAAEAGHPVALAAFADLGRWLSVGLAMATDVLDPEVIVIGGGVVGAARHFLPDAVAGMLAGITGHGHRPAPRVEVARFGGLAGIIGGALLAADAVA